MEDRTPSADPIRLKATDEFRLAAFVPVFAIFLLSFSVIALMEGLYDRYHVFDQTNTLFDADPNKVIVNFSTSWGNDTYFRHPWIDLVFSVPVRATTKVVCNVIGCDRPKTRRTLGLLITPFFGGFKNALLYIIFVHIGVTAVRAGILCSLNLLAFSNLTIGSIPESFPVSSMTIVLFAALMVTSFERARDWRMRDWVIPGAFATGITVTNVVPLVICFFIGRRCGRMHSTVRVLRDATAVAAATLIVTFGAAAVGSLLLSEPISGLVPSAARGDFGVTAPGGSAPEQIAISIANTFVPVIEPQIIHNRFTQNELDPASVPVLDFSLTYAERRLNGMKSIVWTLTTCALIALGAYRASKGTAAWQSLTWLSTALLVFNVVLHLGFYLHDMYLYSLAWEVPLLFLFAGLMRESGRPYYRGIVIALVVGSALASYHVISWFIGAAGAHH